MPRGGKRTPSPGKTMGPSPVTGYESVGIKVPKPIADKVRKYAADNSTEDFKMPLVQAAWEVWGEDYNPQKDISVTPIELVELQNKLAAAKQRLGEFADTIEGLEVESREAKQKASKAIIRLNEKKKELNNLQEKNRILAEHKEALLKELDIQAKDTQETVRQLKSELQNRNNDSALREYVEKFVAKWLKKAKAGRVGPAAKALCADLENLRGIGK